MFDSTSAIDLFDSTSAIDLFSYSCLWDILPRYLFSIAILLLIRVHETPLF